MPKTRKRKATDKPESSKRRTSKKAVCNDDKPKREEAVNEQITVQDTFKIFNDPVHGHMRLHPLCAKIVNTPQFQRLRFIKQLGGAYFLYPGAAHNRFEHSIGVCHLAGTFVRELKKQQEEDSTIPEDDKITDKDILCVEIAGLCHDLGHGPFSHLFDGIVIPNTRKAKWEHEDGSVNMFDFMLKEKTMKKAFDDNGIEKVDLLFIKELFRGPPHKQDFQGRPKEKHFLYQIVSNKESGIDVDKWDYFARDCLMLGMKSNFNHSRIMAFSRVIDVDGKKQICFRDKEARNLYDMFHVRCMLHRNACHHKTTAVVEIMIADALISAIDSRSEEVKYGTKDGNSYTLAEAVDNMEAYSQITDEVLMKIYHSKGQEPKLVEARKITERILTRNLYKFVGEKLFEKQPYKKGPGDKTLDDTVRKEIKEKTGDLFETVENNIVVHLVRLNYGKDEDDPIKFVRFFKKDNPKKASPFLKEDVSYFLPTIFSEQQVLVYCKNEEAKNDVKKVFNEWSRIKDVEEKDKKKRKIKKPKQNRLQTEQDK